jgi:Flp pilus assembly protein TadD
MRSAFIVSESGLAGQQLERLIADAANPKRRMFRKHAELEAWVQEVLNAQELQSVRAHLAKNGHR